jgi:hypothetical protein
MKRFIYKYRTVDTSTLAGLKAAERLHVSGWRMIRSGIYIVQFEKKVEAKVGKAKKC